MNKLKGGFYMKIIDKIYYFYMDNKFCKYIKFIILDYIQYMKINKEIKNFEIITPNSFEIKIGDANVKFEYINRNIYFTIKIDDKSIDKTLYNKKIVFIIYKELRRMYKELKSIRKEYIKNKEKMIKNKLLDK